VIFVAIVLETWQAFLLFGMLLLSLFLSFVGYRNSVLYSNRAAEIGGMMVNVRCDIEGPDDEYARILKMSVEEFKVERQKGRVIFRAGQEVMGIAEGLRSPFRFWR
jgi:hypothetical protein